MTAPTVEYEYEEAARLLRVSEGWLKRNVNRFPHYRMGGKVTFSAEHLDEIRRMHEVRPAGAARPIPSRGRRAS